MNMDGSWVRHPVRACPSMTEHLDAAAVADIVTGDTRGHRLISPAVSTVS